MKKLSKALVTMALMGMMFLLRPVDAAAENGKITVTVEGAYVRETPSTSAKVVASVVKDNVLEVVATETDSAGNTWYKIAVDAKNFGYIRGDLVSASGDVPKPSTGTTGNTTTGNTTTGNEGGNTATTTEPDVKPVEPTTNSTPVDTTSVVMVEPIEGKTTGSVNMRKGPSTNTDKITSVDGGMLVMVYGYQKEGDYVWYYVTYNSSNSGFIRGDFLSLSGELVEKVEEPEPEPEPEPVPEPEPEEHVYFDYEVAYELDENGDTVWYLNDYTEGTRSEITSLLEAKKELETTKEDYEKKLKKKKIGNIVLTFLLVIVVCGSAAGYVFLRRWYLGYGPTEEPIRKEPRNYSPSRNSASNSSRNSVRGNSGNARNTSTRRSDDEFKIETVGGARTAPPSDSSYQTATNAAATGSALHTGSALKSGTTTASGAVILPDGHVQMPDGTIKRAVVGVRQPDGSIKLSDGRVKMPDGTIITPKPQAQEPQRGTSSQQVNAIPHSKPRNFMAEDDDMEFGFLNIDSGFDEE